MCKTNHIELAKRICETEGLTFLGEVGEGAFKKTYLVKTRDERDLALKIIIRGADNARIEREIVALKSCDHVNIGKLLHCGTISENGIPIVFLIEEFLHGGTLGGLLTNGCLPPPAIQRLAFNLSQAVSHLADVEITHRDIKPENIMFRHDGAPVLVDLGIARHLQADSLTKTFLMQGPGTPLFAAPEQLLNDKSLIDWRTDQFSLGVTLSIGAFGIHPYAENGSPEAVVDRVASKARPTSQFLEYAQSSGLHALIKMVEPWPINRYTRPAQLIEAWQINGE